jgi:6-phosphogluconolactonase
MKKVVCFLLFLSILKMNAQDKILKLVVGTYTNKCQSDGIYVYDFNTISGDLLLKSKTSSIENPSYITISNDSKFIYSVNESGNFSKVSAFEFNKSTGVLTLLNQQPTNGNDPCYIINDEKNVISANYSGGNISVFQKKLDGSINSTKQIIQHFGKSINEKRQNSPHVHMVCFSPDHNYILANDLGNDKLYSYKYSKDNFENNLLITDSLSIKPGSGPRHLVFGKNGKYIFLLHELDGTLSVFKYKKGQLKLVQETTIIPDNFTGVISAADIHISPDGLFLYASNRGTANNISIFKILKNKKLDFITATNTLGEAPRNFVIDPTGNFLILANHNSNSIVVFKRNPETGLLTDTGKKTELCSPVCLVFAN